MRFSYKEVSKKEKKKELRLIDATVFYVQCKNSTKIDFYELRN